MNAYLVVNINEVSNLLAAMKRNAKLTYGKVARYRTQVLNLEVNTDSKGDQQISSSSLMFATINIEQSNAKMEAEQCAEAEEDGFPPIIRRNGRAVDVG